MCAFQTGDDFDHEKAVFTPFNLGQMLEFLLWRVYLLVVGFKEFLVTHIPSDEGKKTKKQRFLNMQEVIFCWNLLFNAVSN